MICVSTKHQKCKAASQDVETGQGDARRDLHTKINKDLTEILTNFHCFYWRKNYLQWQGLVDATRWHMEVIFEALALTEPMDPSDPV